MKKIVLVIVLLTTSIFAEGKCGYSFYGYPDSLTLSNGYIKNYIEKQDKETPEYISFSIDVNNSDRGYVYCLATMTKNGKKCIDNIDQLLDSKAVKFVELDDKFTTYFFIHKNATTMDVILPIINQFVYKDKIELFLTAFQTKKAVKKCDNKDLAIEINEFDLKYNIKQKVTEKGHSVEVKVLNKDLSNIIVTDVFNTDNTLNPSIGKDTIKLTALEGVLSGFCTTIVSRALDNQLIESKDYFCKIITDVDFNEESGKNKFLVEREITNNNYLKVDTKVTTYKKAKLIDNIASKTKNLSPNTKSDIREARDLKSQFCIDFGNEETCKQLEFITLRYSRVFRKIQKHLEKEWEFVELAESDKKSGQAPHVYLGFDRAQRLIKAGFTLHSDKRYGKNGKSFVKVGPYEKKDILKNKKELLLLTQ